MGARLLSIVALAAAFMFAHGEAVLAGRDWCATDPILTFANGTEVQWVAAFDAAGLDALSGPVTYWIEVPSNVGPIGVTIPSSAAPEQVTVAYTGKRWDGRGPIQVRAQITVNTTGLFATSASVRGNVQKGQTVSGTSNTPMKLASSVSPDAWSPLLAVDGPVSTQTIDGTTTVFGP